MPTNVTPTLQRVLGELQTVKTKIDRQIAAIRSLIRSSAKRPSPKTARPRTLVGYARDRRALAKQKKRTVAKQPAVKTARPRTLVGYASDRRALVKQKRARKPR